MNRIKQAATHESGHAVAALAAGLRVEELSVSSNGDGSCILGNHARFPADELIVCFLAGGAAEELLCGSGSVSGDDRLAIATAEAALTFDVTNRIRRLFVERAFDVVSQHRLSIEWLAAQLERERTLNAAALGRLCWQDASPLRSWRYLYQRPTSEAPLGSQRTRGRTLGVQRA